MTSAERQSSNPEEKPTAEVEENLEELKDNITDAQSANKPDETS